MTGFAVCSILASTALASNNAFLNPLEQAHSTNPLENPEVCYCRSSPWSCRSCLPPVSEAIEQSFSGFKTDYKHASPVMEMQLAKIVEEMDGNTLLPEGAFPVVLPETDSSRKQKVVFFEFKEITRLQPRNKITIEKISFQPIAMDTENSSKYLLQLELVRLPNGDVSEKATKFWRLYLKQDVSTENTKKNNAWTLHAEKDQLPNWDKILTADKTESEVGYAAGVQYYDRNGKSEILKRLHDKFLGRDHAFWQSEKSGRCSIM